MKDVGRTVDSGSPSDRAMKMKIDPASPGPHRRVMMIDPTADDLRHAGRRAARLAPGAPLPTTNRATRRRYARAVAKRRADR
jgi:hypothetical protein